MSEDKRRYQYSELEEENNKVPLWLLLLYGTMIVVFVVYLIRYFY